MVTYSLETTKCGLLEITEKITEIVRKSGIKSGLVQIFIPHSTAGIVIISRMDALGFTDIEDEINRLIPTRIDFKHQFDTPADAAGHIKSALTGVSISVPIEDGSMQLGASQGIFFFEFDGPRQRQFHVQLISSGLREE